MKRYWARVLALLVAGGVAFVGCGAPTPEKALNPSAQTSAPSVGITRPARASETGPSAAAASAVPTSSDSASRPVPATVGAPVVAPRATTASPAPTADPQESGGCLIKGNISSSGERIYHVPGQQNYAATVITESKGERWFCTEAEALAAGWRRAKR